MLALGGWRLYDRHEAHEVDLGFWWLNLGFFGRLIQLVGSEPEEGIGVMPVDIENSVLVRQHNQRGKSKQQI